MEGGAGKIFGLRQGGGIFCLQQRGGIFDAEMYKSPAPAVNSEPSLIHIDCFKFFLFVFRSG